MSTAAADYSIRVAEFVRARSPLGLLLHGQAGERGIPYCLTVLRSAEHTVLVDSGYQHAGRGRELADEDGISVWQDPAGLMTRAGAAPGTWTRSWSPTPTEIDLVAAVLDATLAEIEAAL